MATIKSTDETFDNIVKENKIVLTDFWATWCGPCVTLAPILEQLSDELNKVFKKDSYKILGNMWGDKPSKWKADLNGYKRYRTIINYFTRMRYLDQKGSLLLKKKDLKPQKNHIPWFKQTISNLKPNEYIIFGHWAALDGKTKLDNIIGLDTGCVWGNKLTAMRLEDKKLFQVKKK